MLFNVMVLDVTSFQRLFDLDISALLLRPTESTPMPDEPL